MGTIRQGQTYERRRGNRRSMMDMAEEGNSGRTVFVEQPYMNTLRRLAAGMLLEGSVSKKNEPEIFAIGWSPCRMITKA